jgi:hypothetical protein
MSAYGRVLVLCIAATTGGCITEIPNPATQYVQRTDTVTLAAGDAQDVNAAAQTIDPWPPYAANRHIPGNGQRMVGAVERYEGSGRGPAPTASNAANGGAPPPAGAPPLYPLAPVSPAGNQ